MWAWHLLTQPAASLDIQEESVDQREREHGAASNRLKRWCWLFSHHTCQCSRGTHTLSLSTSHTHTHRSMHADIDMQTQLREIWRYTWQVSHLLKRDRHNTHTVPAPACQQLFDQSYFTGDGMCSLCICAPVESPKTNTGTTQSPQAGRKRVLIVTEKHPDGRFSLPWDHMYKIRSWILLITRNDVTVTDNKACAEVYIGIL